MEKRQWTREQALAICDTRGTLLLSAAAGSGKTAVLVERVLRMLTRKKNPIPADRLLIATFSLEAAKELRRRLDKGLGALLQNDPGNGLYRRQQLLLQKADISTISAFCGRLAREHFQELELSSDFRIAENEELSDLRTDVMDEVLEEQYQNEADFAQLVEFLCGKDDEKLGQVISEIYEFIRSLPFGFRWLDERLADYQTDAPVLQTAWGQVLAENAKETLEYAGKLLRDAVCLMEKDEKIAAAYQDGYLAAVQLLSDIRRILDNGDWDAFYFAVRDFKLPSVRQLRGYKGHPLKERVSGMRDDVKKKMEKLAGQLAGTESDFAEDRKTLYPMIRILFDTVKLFELRFSAAKREKNIADFSDLEHFALRLLVEETPDGFVRTPLAKQLSEEYDALLIDEYQDTNGVQDAMFMALSRDENNLFLVGDVKQSIYRFRQAMPEIFLKKREEYARYDRKHYPAALILGRNFRSRRSVTDTVNYLFGQLMSRELGEIDYNADEELVPGADYAETGGADAAEFHVIDKAGEKYPEKDAVYEARYIAGLVRRMLDEGYRVKDGDEMRPCRPGDFCILLRAQKNKASVYAQALNLAGIMTWADTDGAFLGSREVSALLSLLQAIDNPLADIPLLAAMLSPMFSFTADDLAAIRLESPDGSFYLALNDCARNGNQKCTAFLEKLSDYRQLAAVLQTDRLIDYLLDDTDFMDILQVMPDASQRRSNIRLFRSYAVQYGKAGFSGLSGFLRLIARMQEKNTDMKSASRPPDGEDTVRIMSIHASKGLEFPICIVADCGKGFNLQDLYTNGLNSRLGFSMRVRKPEQLKQYTNVPFEAVKLENERLMKSEEMRILYVALTRAKEKLIMTMTTDDLKSRIGSLLPALGEKQKLPHYAVRSARSFGDWLMMAMLRNPDAEPLWQTAGQSREYTLRCDSPIRVSVAPPPKEAIASEQEERHFVQSADAMLYDRLKQQADYCYPYEEEARLPSKLSVTQITSLQTGESRISLSAPRFLQEEVMTGAEKGTAVHTFLQFADFDQCRTDLAAEVKRMVDKQFITPMQGEALRMDKLEAFFRSPVCDLILGAQHAYREYKFMYEIPAKELYEDAAGEETILVQGIADCVVENTDGIVIVDYKTDQVSSPEILIQRYAPQLSLYRRAISQQFQKPVEQCVIYSVELEQEIEVL